VPNWTDVEIDYRPYGAGSEPFVKSRHGFSAAGLGKDALAAGSRRQDHFEAELLRLRDATGTETLPVFVSFNGERRRMDKGCIGHAVARGFIEQVCDGPDGTVASVSIRRRP
jgi:hypothetical protein